MVNFPRKMLNNNTAGEWGALSAKMPRKFSYRWGTSCLCSVIRLGKVMRFRQRSANSPKARLKKLLVEAQINFSGRNFRTLKAMQFPIPVARTAGPTFIIKVKHETSEMLGGKTTQGNTF